MLASGGVGQLLAEPIQNEEIRRAIPSPSPEEEIRKPVPKDIYSDLTGEREAPEMHDVLSLEDCIRVALRNNRKRPASRFEIEMAEAQHRQALAGYWPHLTVNALASLRSEDLSFIFPESQFALPATSIETPPTVVALPNLTFETPPLSFTIERGSIAPGFPPADLNVPLPPQKLPVNG